MPRVFLSPSTHGGNSCVVGLNERYYMNLIADAMVPYLLASAIDYGRNDPDDTMESLVRMSNEGNYNCI